MGSRVARFLYHNAVRGISSVHFHFLSTVRRLEDVQQAEQTEVVEPNAVFRKFDEIFFWIFFWGDFF